MRRSTISPILSANLSHYQGGDEQEEYLERSHHRERIEKAISFIPNRIGGGNGYGIEIGAGTGKTAVKIREKGGAIIAADASLPMAKRCVKRGIDSVVFNVEEPFPFRSDAFDFVFAAELIEHIFDTRFFLAECHRVLRKRGRLIITTPNLGTLNDRLKFLFGISPRQIDAFHPYLFLHIRQFTRSSLVEALAKANFNRIRVTTHRLEFKAWGKKLVLKNVPGCFSSLGKSLIGCAEK